ncbi:imidazole glycerol phosphate synthase subunit HisH [Alphaproteobacteria bacterium]|nr:imidazole glycerol phosphate synthase subunit HisH [Alphaproteobacteria bacterium]
MIYIVPFDFCNLASISRYFNFNEIEFEYLDRQVTVDVNDDVIVIPGVGSFHEGMNFLRATQLAEKIRNHNSLGGRIVGICLGMQLMFDKSDESPGIKGLGLLHGKVKRLSNIIESVPRIGWDSVNIFRPSSSYSKFDNAYVNNDCKEMLSADFYFVHSYHCVPEEKTAISGTFLHGGDKCCASIERRSLYGFQFHPEKSGPLGYMVLDAIFL